MAQKSTNFKFKARSTDADANLHTFASESVDEGQWEDVPQPEALITPPSSDSRYSPSITPHKRRTGRGVYVAAPPRKQFVIPTPTSQPVKALPSPSPPPPSRPSVPIISKEELAVELGKGVSFTVKYCLDVFHRAVLLLRGPLSVILFLYLLSLLIVRVSNTLKTAFAPLCMVPGISRSAWCRPSERHGPDAQARWADYPKLVDVQSTTFEQLLDQSVSGSGLSLEIKKAEMATSDLITLVRVSDLKSRDMLAESLVEFVGDAKVTGRGLQKLNSKVAGAVDSCVHPIILLCHILIWSRNTPG
jgi:hypothetical protein